MEAIKAVAQRLGNTPSVCRKCYVHPAVLECYMKGLLANGRKRQAEEVGDDASSALREEKGVLMRSLRQSLKSAG